ncbi:MAG: FtsQ-type POTRA domain-containing protein [Alphaproteobacteria bacterium]|nr:FtsQ-type POTRA domain-containing protein [Alphaproteobacteria bacterium]
MRFLNRRKTASPRIKAPRRRLNPLWLKPALKTLGVATVIGGLGFGVGWLWRAGMIQTAVETVHQRALSASAAIGLSIDDVLVVGRVETARADVLQALGIERGMPILAVDPVAAKQRLEALPWVRSATVERRLPDTVFVRLTEHQAIALWQRNNRLLPIGRDGTAVMTREIERFNHLLVVVGDDAPAHTPALLEMLVAEPELAGRVTAAIRIGNRRWNLNLDHGIELRLPESDMARAWAWIARLEREHRVLARDVATIDLRLPDRLIVRATPEATKPEPVKKTAAPGRNT